MRLILPIVVFYFSISIVRSENPPANLLPKSSAWSERSIEIDGNEFSFRVAEINVTLKKQELVKPKPGGRMSLLKFVSQFLHEWEHTKDFKRLSAFFDSEDDFQESEVRFEALDHSNRSVAKRSYSYLIEREDFLFLIGVKHKTDGSTERVIGTYFWNGDRFYVVINTREFETAGGLKFRKALSDTEIESILETRSL